MTGATDESAKKDAATRVEAIWEPFLTGRDREVHAASGAGQRIGFGHRPALIVVDVSYGFLGEEPQPVLASVRRWPLSCGEYGWAALPVIRRLLAACRRKGLPIIYSTGASAADGPSAGMRNLKKLRMAEDHTSRERGNEIVEEIKPKRGDIVIRKLMPSAFFGTPLLSHLIERNVDTLLVTGTVTSNCVRATVVDAVSHNLHCTVVADACFDRIEASHAINLFDMNAKYADVVCSGEVLDYVASLPSDVFPRRRRFPGDK